MEPFKCEFVPADRLVLFMHKNQALWVEVYRGYLKYREVLHAYCQYFDKNKPSRRTLDSVHRKYCTKKNPMVQALFALIQLEFNYMDSTIATGSVLTRMVRIHEGSRTL